jgi:hypothetical protein
MKMWRPRLKSVMAVVLLWQLAGCLLLAGPAMAAVHAGSAMSAGATHCHAHGAAGTATAPAPASDSSAPTHHTTAPDCCQDMSDCRCVCAQGTAAIPRILTTMLVVTDQPDDIDLRSPAFVWRTTEVFRPPI